MKFKSRKDLLFSIVILGLNSYLIGVISFGLGSGDLKTQELALLIVVLGVVVLLFWLYFGTHYKLSQEDGLLYRSGPFYGKIKIDRITEIIKGKTLWVGLKPATSRKGLIIKYDKYNEIYISPKTNDNFIEKLLELKSDIKITE